MSPSPPICRWVEDGSLVEEDGGSFTNWIPGQPAGGEAENCMQLYSDVAQWNDFDCDPDIGPPAVCSKPTTTTTTTTTTTRTTTTPKRE